MGVFPFMIMALIYRNVPRKKTNELLLLGERLTAEEAREAGIVNKVVPADEFDAAVDEWAKKLASKSPVMMKLGKDAMYRQMDMPFDDALDYLRSQLSLALHHRGHRGGRDRLLREAGAEVDRPVSLVALRCRTSDRTPSAAPGVDALAPLVAKRLGREPRSIGEPGEPGPAPTTTDLRDSRGCLLEAGGQVDDALDGGGRAGDPRARVLGGADHAAHRAAPPPRRARCCGSTRTATSTPPTPRPSGYLGGMALAGACGLWDAGLGVEGVDPERVVLAGVRDLDDAERVALERSDGDRDRRQHGRDAGGGEQRARARAGVRPPRPRRDRPRAVPRPVPGPGGLTPERLLDVLEAVAGECELVGLEVTAFEAPDDPDERSAAAAVALDVLEPLLHAISEEAHVHH